MSPYTHTYTLRGHCHDTYPDVMCHSDTPTTKHSPPLLYNVNIDPSEVYPLDTVQYADILNDIVKVHVNTHVHIHNYVL